MPPARTLRLAFCNYWDGFDPEKNWFVSRFRRNFPGIELLHVEANTNPDILVASVFGPLDPARQPAGVKILFSGECLANRPHYDNRDQLLGIFDLVIGFDSPTSEKMVRFPLWLLCYPIVKRRAYYERRIGNTIRENWEHKSEFACLVARTDLGNLRTTMLDALKEVGVIACPSRVGHNHEPIGPSASDKVEFMNRFAFNLCPENRSSPGYVTEKLFDCFGSYSIPIYWGDQPAEPGIINSERVLYFDFNEPEASVDRVRQIWNDRSLLEEWFSRPIFKPGALEVVEALDSDLDRSLARVLESVLP